MRISDWSSDVCSSDLNSLFVGCFLGLPDHVQQFAYCVGLTLCLDRLAIKEVMRLGNQVLNVEADGFIGGGIVGNAHQNIRSIISRSEEHTSELQSLMRNSYAVFCFTNNNEINLHHSIKFICFISVFL